MAFYKWLQCGFPRYIKPTAHKLETKSHKQDTFQLAFVTSMHGNQDTLVSSDGNGRISLWAVCPFQGVHCIWQSGLSTAFQSTQSAYFQQHTWQHEGVLAVADMRSTRLQTINQILGREEGCIYSVPHILELPFSLAWSSQGSCLAICTSTGCLRLYHDQGKHCTLVQSTDFIQKVVFVPEDLTMVYCITHQGVKLLSLRAHPECAAFCQAADNTHRTAPAAAGHQAAALAASSMQDWRQDPIASSWLPPAGPCPPVPQARPSLPSCLHADKDLQLTEQSAGIGRSQTAGHNSSPDNQRHPQQTGPSRDVQQSLYCEGHDDRSSGSAVSTTTAAAEDVTPSSRQSLDHARSHRASAASEQQHLCQGSPAASLPDIQLTYSRQKRQRTDTSCCNNPGPKRKPKADYGWLQGADAAPAPELSRCSNPAAAMSTVLWSSHEVAETAAAHTSAEARSSGYDESADTNSTLVWYTADTAGTGCFDPKTARYHYPFSGHTQAVTQVLPLQNGLHILTSSLDGTHKLWTVEGKGLCTCRAVSGGGRTAAACLSKCENFVLAGHGSSVYVWNIAKVLADAGGGPDADGNHCRQLIEHDCTVTAVALSGCGTMMASADASGRLVIRFSTSL